MLGRVSSLGFLLIVLSLLLLAGSAAAQPVAQSVSPRCQAAMDRAAGNYSRCLLRADADYARHDNLTKLKRRAARGILTAVPTGSSGATRRANAPRATW